MKSYSTFEPADYSIIAPLCACVLSMLKRAREDFERKVGGAMSRRAMLSYSVRGGAPL